MPGTKQKGTMKKGIKSKAASTQGWNLSTLWIEWTSESTESLWYSLFLLEAVGQKVNQPVSSDWIIRSHWLST